MKTTTAALVFLSNERKLRGDDLLVLWGHTVPRSAVEIARSILLSYLFVILFSLFFLGFLQPDLFSPGNLSLVLFEVISALTTTGLSLGITGMLSEESRFFFCFLMLFGRIGPVMAALLLADLGKKRHPIGYPEENIMIG